MACNVFGNVWCGRCVYTSRETKHVCDWGLCSKAKGEEREQALFLLCRENKSFPFRQSIPPDAAQGFLYPFTAWVTPAVFRSWGLSFVEISSHSRKVHALVLPLLLHKNTPCKHLHLSSMEKMHLLLHISSALHMHVFTNTQVLTDVLECLSTSVNFCL